MGDKCPEVTDVPPVVDGALEAADRLEEEGISVEVIDMRSLKPLDMDTVLKSVQKTGCVVIVEEGPKTGGIGAEIAASIAEASLPYIDGRIVRVAAGDMPIPSAMELENALLPNTEQILAACRSALSWD